MRSVTRSPPPVLRVFNIPELGSLICAHVHKRNNASLSRVCRQLFHNVIPFVWESTDAIITLISMIPGAGVVVYDGEALPPHVVSNLNVIFHLDELNYINNEGHGTPQSPRPLSF